MDEPWDRNDLPHNPFAIMAENEQIEAAVEAGAAEAREVRQLLADLSGRPDTRPGDIFVALAREQSLLRKALSISNRQVELMRKINENNAWIDEQERGF